MDIQVLRQIPSLETLLISEQFQPLLNNYNRELVVENLREILEEIRSEIRMGEIDTNKLTSESLAEQVRNQLQQKFNARLVRVINVTGTITHTNLGRALLSEEACQALTNCAQHYVNLEYDMKEGIRGHRDNITELLFQQLTGCEASTVVNNNAAAVLLSLNTLAKGKEVIVSRGELIEIGGAFRIPEVMEASGAILKEVGTTNRTYVSDYEKAINENTALLLKVHPSNYRIEGFASSPEMTEIVELGNRHKIPTMEDLGSGSLIDLTKYGLPHEPIVKERIKADVDIVTFSGDKLLGGPQAGIIIGKKELIAQIRRNPLMRAMRVGKLTIAALEATLRLYLNESTLMEKLPMLRFYTRPFEEIRQIAEALAVQLNQIFGDVVDVSAEECYSQIGSGSLPIETIKSMSVAFTSSTISIENLAQQFRNHEVPIIGRVSEGKFIMDMRSTTEEDIREIKQAARKIVTMFQSDENFLLG
ncbi:L-seryl-tRNA(Sec) selenium transferase [Candidatus Poribacteria bacterium]|nr:L-seryl-tRNA(Sec) selenium transferase [Candidatus Poribacteria bacterium]